MATTLSNLIDNLTKGIQKIKCKDCDCFFEYESVKDNWIKYKCLFCNKNYSSKIGRSTEPFRAHLSFLLMISINLFCC